MIAAVATAFLAFSASSGAASSSPAGRSRPGQSTVAATAAFGVVPSSAVDKEHAIDAKDLADAGKMVGKPGAFQGTVSNVYSPRDHDIVILDFDLNYRSALTAVVMAGSYAKFPALKSLTGKHVLITGKFTDYHGKPEIILTNPAQVKVLR